MLSNKSKETVFININSNLPVEIVNEIEEYFVSIEDCDSLLQWFEDNYHLNCCATEVEELTNHILKSKEAIAYLSKKNNYFRDCYKKHFIEKEKMFKLMNPTCSFITSILMYMWH